MDEDNLGEISAWCGARHRPEPPRVLERQTRFTASEIKLMYRGFKQECPSGVVDEETFKHIFSQFFPLGDASQYAHHVFNTVKHKHSPNINFEEFLLALSRVARGSTQEKLSWVFNLYDTDGDGRISRQELAEIVKAIYQLLGRSTSPPCRDQDVLAHADRVFTQMDVDADGAVSREELCAWVLARPHAAAALHTLDTTLDEVRPTFSNDTAPSTTTEIISPTAKLSITDEPTAFSNVASSFTSPITVLSVNSDAPSFKTTTTTSLSTSIVSNVTSSFTTYTSTVTLPVNSDAPSFKTTPSTSLSTLVVTAVLSTASKSSITTNTISNASKLTSTSSPTNISSSMTRFPSDSPVVSCTVRTSSDVTSSVLEAKSEMRSRLPPPVPLRGVRIKEEAIRKPRMRPRRSSPPKSHS